MFGYETALRVVHGACIVDIVGLGLNLRDRACVVGRLR